jgi:hypothetical protein
MRVLAVTILAATWTGCVKEPAVSCPADQKELAPFEPITEKTTEPLNVLYVIAEDDGKTRVTYYLYSERNRKVSSDYVVNYSRCASLDAVADEIAKLPERCAARVGSPYQFSAGRRVLRPLTKAEVAQLKELLLKR